MTVNNTATTDDIDTSVSEDTSTNDDAQDTDDIDLEDIEVELDDSEESDAEDTEESTEEADSDESAESEDTEAEESTDDVEESEDDKSKESKEKSDKQEQVTPEEQKRRNAEFAQKRIAEKEALEKSKKEAQAKYLEAAEDDKDLAVRQLQIDAYNNKIENNTAKLENGLTKALGAIDLFRVGTPAVQERLLRAVDQFEALHVRKDRNGDPIEVTGDVFQYLQDEANSIRQLLGEGAKKQISKKANQKSRTLKTPSKAPKKAKLDLAMEGFDEEAADLLG